ncbi:unnamed protein product [Sphagnum balticum]
MSDAPESGDRKRICSLLMARSPHARTHTHTHFPFLPEPCYLSPRLEEIFSMYCSRCGKAQKSEVYNSAPQPWYQTGR